MLARLLARLLVRLLESGRRPEAMSAYLDHVLRQTVQQDGEGDEDGQVQQEHER